MGVSGYLKPPEGLETKTDWLTNRQLQSDLALLDKEFAVVQEVIQINNSSLNPRHLARLGFRGLNDDLLIWITECATTNS
jgi:hypothetical protein